MRRSVRRGLKVKSMTDTRSLFREARLRLREETIDPEGKLPADERRRLAEEADHRHFQEAGKRSGESRRRRAALLETLQRESSAHAAVDRVVAELVTS